MTKQNECKQVFKNCLNTALAFHRVVTEGKGRSEYREFQALSANNITNYVINPQQTGKEIKQNRQCKYQAILRRLFTTIAAEEKQ